MAVLNNIYVPSAVNKLFLWRAMFIENIDAIYESLVDIAANEVDLLIAAKDALLAAGKPQWAEAMNIDTQRALIRALGLNLTATIGPVDAVLYPTQEAGPGAVTATRAGAHIQLSVAAPADPAWTHVLIAVGREYHKIVALTGANPETPQVRDTPNTPLINLAWVRFAGDLWLSSKPSAQATYT